MKRNTTILWGLCLLVALSASTWARTICVATTGDDLTGDGSPEHPYRTIQKGINVAVNGDTVDVEAGTYRENIVWESKSLEALEGDGDVNGDGHPDTIVDGDVSDPPDGTGDGTCLTIKNVSETPRVTGFTFQNGSARDGGGLLLDNADLTVDANEITGNTATSSGGALYLKNGSRATLTGNKIENNKANWGGGLYLVSSPATLTDNKVNGNTAVDGGGLYLASSAATLTGNEVSGNTADYSGGGLYLSYSAATLTGNNININLANQGGGLYLSSSPATLTGNTVKANTAGSGGGLYLSNSEALLTGNTVEANPADYSGGGLYLFSSPATLTGNNININLANEGGGLYLYYSNATLDANFLSYNTAQVAGGGVYLTYSDGATLTNNLVVLHNMAVDDGSGVYLFGSDAVLTNNTVADNDGEGVMASASNPGSPTITNCILWNNRGEGDLVNASATYSDIGTGNTAGEGNISEDPLFVDPANGDYYLKAGSPCIDAGTNDAPELPDTDMDGDLRILDGNGDGIAIVDMGADEYTGPSTGRIFGTVTDKATGKALAQVKVTLYDSNGKVGATTTDSSGYYEFTDLPAETYRLKFKKKGYKSATKKNVTVPPDQEVNVPLQKKKGPASIAWMTPPRPKMASGESQTVRWRVAAAGEEVDGTALVCSAGGDPVAQATATLAGVEVAPGEYKATISGVSPGKWHYAAVAVVDGDTVATKPVAVMVK